ncbi:hypothetical protein PF008_g31169 [Phytophthora fragariae]|uniref:Uncharacterized protein n=1 Tax=Phytophthora fragariae TaxID=53985 RepID=A0A6G0Q3J6_9STRA|nr:hypothetical protein PF008_g31169 [Phytophthora fragariae]
MSLDLKLYSGLALHDRSLTGQEAVLPLPDSVLLPLTDSVVVLPKSMKQREDLAATRRSSTAVHADSMVELRMQHLAATRAWASEMPTNSELLLLKQHLDMAATRLSASVVLAD